MNRFFYTFITLAVLVTPAFGSSWCPLFQLENAGVVDVNWNFDEAKAAVKFGDKFGVISPFVKRALVGDEILPLGDFPRFINGDIWVSIEFLEKLGVDKQAFKLCAGDLPKANVGWGLVIRRIVIDPGHGGKDMGVLTEGVVPEKELTLAFAQNLKHRLEEQGFKVALTRSEDKFLSLSERTDVAEQVKADLFISLHFNGWENPKVRGFEVYFPSTIPSSVQVKKIVEKENLAFAAESQSADDFVNVYWRFKKEQDIVVSSMLARLIDKSINANVKGVISRGAIGAPFFVLVKSPIPSVLIEFGYLTNASDAKLLFSDEYMDALLDSIVQAVCACDIVLWVARGGGKWQDKTGAEPAN